jgi:ABC-type protease/lipase transport system fused ATPase/permease subunit
LARLLVGLENPTRGAVRLDGAKLVDWRADELGQYIGYLPQDVQLFSGTVSENISGLDPNPDGRAVVEAAKRAHVHDVILRLPNGYNTDIGPDGALLSAGQRQRVALARALYANRRVIVLDEPNANLDPAGEEALTKAVLGAKERGCAVIIITHRFNILSIVDKMLVLRNGQTVNYGDAKTILKEMFGADIRTGQGRFSVIESKEGGKGGRKGASAPGAAQAGGSDGQPTARATGTTGASFGGQFPQPKSNGGQGGQQ